MLTETFGNFWKHMSGSEQAAIFIDCCCLFECCYYNHDCKLNFSKKLLKVANLWMLLWTSCRQIFSTMQSKTLTHFCDCTRHCNSSKWVAWRTYFTHATFHTELTQLFADFALSWDSAWAQVDWPWSGSVQVWALFSRTQTLTIGFGPVDWWTRTQNL